ncbi:hypothetical protein STEG23_030743, partial [Scotinomys teguina]
LEERCVKTYNRGYKQYCLSLPEALSDAFNHREPSQSEKTQRQTPLEIEYWATLISQEEKTTRTIQLAKFICYDTDLRGLRDEFQRNGGGSDCEEENASCQRHPRSKLIKQQHLCLDIQNICNESHAQLE